MRSHALSIGVLLTLVAPSIAAAQTDASLAGAWVSSDAKRALDAGQAVDVGCFLEISAEPLEIAERCGGGRSTWTSLEVAQRKGSVEVKASGSKRLVNRAGTPNELEYSDVRGLHRLYRIPTSQEETLAEWAMLPPSPAPAAAAETPEEPEPAPDEAPKAATSMGEPIVPKPRLCGCGAAEAGLGALGFLVVLGWRQHTRGRRRTLEG